MYKHANNVIKEKNKISSVSSQMNARHGIALKRLKQNVTKVGQMTQQAESTYNVDISLPSISLNDEDDEESNSGQTQPKDSSIRSRVENASALQEQGEKRMPDAEKIEKIMKKVMEAENDSIPEWELASNRKRELRLKKSARRRRTDNAQHSQRTIVALERKLALAIKRRHSDEGDGNDESSTQKVVLRPRDLVPNYKLADVRNFLDGFFRVDKNLSGLLDVDEWVEFFLTMNKSMTAQAARQLFSHVDTNRDGVLSLHELVPVIFSEATSSQVSLILKYIDEEVTRNMKTYRKDEIYKEDMAILFETYDADNIGYIKVQLVRDKLAQFRLPVAAQLAFTQKLKDMEDGDMVNLPEFTRMFISYMSYRNEENDDDD
jgi:Ca2+-binding EF-hand superfamily protein